MFTSPQNDRRHTGPHTAPASPALSRTSSISSNHSIASEPGAYSTDRSRQSSTSSVSSQSYDSYDAYSSYGFKSLFSRSKKSKDPKTGGRMVITSKHAAAVRARLTTDPQFKTLRGKKVRVANVVGLTNTGHLTGEAQEMRHPHSGPPATRVKKGARTELPLLARVVSGDLPDEEDDHERRLQWAVDKKPGVDVVMERSMEASRLPSGIHTPHESISSIAFDADELTRRMNALNVDTIRPNLYRQKTPIGLRYQRDEQGKWTR